jgi:acetolactate synthase-1/3 small subunit
MKDIVYDIAKVSGKVGKHTLAVLVDNEFGVLARVIGLFSGRGYNIESLTVAEVEHDKGLSRITIVTSGSESVINQIKRLLERMVPVYQVNDLTVEGPHVERELTLVKIKAKGKIREQAIALGEKFHARLLPGEENEPVFEMTGTSSKVNDFIEQMREFGITEMARSGVVAIARETK